MPLRVARTEPYFLMKNHAVPEFAPHGTIKRYHARRTHRRSSSPRPAADRAAYHRGQGTEVLAQSFERWTHRVLRCSFQGSAFNGDISSWDTGSVLSMPMMFADSAFNQTIAAWNVSKVTDFHHIPVLYIGGKASMTRTGSERIPHGASTLTES